MAIEHHSVGLIGYGREGKSVHRFLARTSPGTAIGIFDRAPVTPLELGNTSPSVYSGEAYLSHLSDYPLLVRSPGIPPTLPAIEAARRRGAVITTLMNLFMEHAPGRIIGVTGTKGKSTTASLTAQLLRTTYPDVRLVGNIGYPALDQLEEATDETIFVTELSSFQLEDCNFSPHIAVLLEVFPEHLDHHGSFDAYLDAKLRILRFQKEVDTAILSAHASHLVRSQYEGPAMRRYFSSNGAPGAAIALTGDEVRHHTEEGSVLLAHTDGLPLRGPGNLQNVLAACAVATQLGVPPTQIQDGLAHYRPLEHRLEYVGDFKEIRFYNDSLATIPQAAINALESLGEEVETLIVGGFDRGVDQSPLAEAIQRRLHHLRTLVLFPTTGRKVWDALLQIGGGELLPRRIDAATMEEAVECAYRYTTPGKICLLSPASSSFSIFRDYIERGERFKAEVRRLGESYSTNTEPPK